MGKYYDIIIDYTPVGDIAALMFCIAMTIILLETSVKKGKKYRIFHSCLVMLSIACIANIFLYKFSLSDSTPFAMIYLLRAIYHVLLLMILSRFVDYLNELLAIEDVFARVLMVISRSVIAIAIVLDLLSPIFHTGMYLDENGIVVNASSYAYFSLAYGFTLVLLGFQLICYRKRLFYRVQRALVVLELLSCSVVIAGEYFAGNSYLTLTFLPPMLLVLIMIHANSYDINTGALGRESFTDYTQRLYQKPGGKAFYLVLMVYDGAERIKEDAGGKLFYRLWTDYFAHTHLYNLADDLYVLTVDTTNTPINEDSMYRLLDQDFPHFVERFQLKWKVVGAELPYGFTVNEFQAGIHRLIDDMEMNKYLICGEKESVAIGRRRIIANHLKDICDKKDFNDERVLVYAQPVYNVKRKCYDTAEALMRLKLPELGLVFPDDFIPLAEEYGFIHTLSLIIFNKTCKEIRYLLDKGYDISRISVNFSVIELHQEDFVKEIEDIIEANGIPTDKVAIEFTESRTDEDYATVLERVKELKKDNIHLYLDDFGTGYSNFDRIIRLKLNVVKFDRSLLLMMDDETKKLAKAAGVDHNSLSNAEELNDFLKTSLEKNEGILLIKHFSRAFHEMGYEILYEGVENELMEHFCVMSHADYLQGYKYSKPVPIEELRDRFFHKKESQDMQTI